MKIHELLKQNATLFPSQTFLYTDKSKITYVEAWDKVRKTAAGFRLMGVGVGDRVEFFAGDSIEFILAMFSVFAIGAIASFIDLGDSARFQEYHSLIDPKLLLYDNKSLIQEFSLGSARPLNLSGDDFSGLVDTYDPFEEIDLPDETPCHLAFTSGTTYLPKPVLLGHEPTCRATRIIAERFGLVHEDITFSITPYSNSHVLVYGLLPQLHRAGSTGFLEGRWDPIKGPEKAWKTMKKNNASFFSGNTYRLRVMADYAIEKAVSKGKLRKVVSGGGPGYQSLRNKWKKLGVSFIETYGKSECGGALAETPLIPVSQGKMVYKPLVPSSGQIMPDKEVKIVDNNGREAPRGVPGEIIFRGGYMVGYWRMPEETTEKIKKGWLYTGDIGFMDEHDILYWLARGSDLISKSDGTVLYPRISEEALYLHPGVAQASVLGIDSESQGQVPFGFVVPYPKKRVNEKELIQFCRKKLPPDYVPRKIFIREAFPMTASGKIEKKSLRAIVNA